jgi:hypothetical protein
MIISYFKLLPSHINRNRCQMSSSCPPRSRISGIEIRTGWHMVKKEYIQHEMTVQLLNMNTFLVKS